MGILKKTMENRKEMILETLGAELIKLKNNNNKLIDIVKLLQSESLSHQKKLENYELSLMRLNKTVQSVLKELINSGAIEEEKQTPTAAMNSNKIPEMEEVDIVDDVIKTMELMKNMIIESTI